LVRRKLADDKAGQDLILDLLRRIYRAELDGSRQALSGKPVIIAYLFELIDELRGGADAIAAGDLTEWQIYRMIVDCLMLRDQQRSPLDPRRRRRCLQHLAILTSQREAVIAREQTFYEVIEQEFRTDLRLMEPEERRHRWEELFEDLRGSSTLTRSELGSGWRFSHNSLREYLSAERFVASVSQKQLADIRIPISAAMRAFVGSITSEDFESMLNILQELWQTPTERPKLGGYLTLLWDGIIRQNRISGRTLQKLLPRGDTGLLPLNGLKLSQIDFDVQRAGSETLILNCIDSELSEVSFNNLDLSGSKFSGAVLDSVLLLGCKLTGPILLNV
jgi:hypothetical protein